MAIYYLAIQSLSRSQGRNAIAASAYRSGERLVDKGSSRTFDYRHRGGIESTGLIGWKDNRGSLWNAAEQAEKRRNSIVAREIVVATPHELNATDRQLLVERFATWLNARHQVAVDFAIHAPGRGSDERNHHAHLLMTTRRVEDQHLAGKSRELDDRRQSSGHVEAWRTSWAEMVNERLADRGVRELIDHRSYKRQAGPGEIMPRVALIHLGPAETQLIRRGVSSRLAAENARRELANRTVAAVRAGMLGTTDVFMAEITAAADLRGDGRRQITR